MPLYEYRCRDCAAHFERIKKASSPKDGICPECGGVTRRLIGAPCLQFKGSGWYVTDYGNVGGSKSPEDAELATDPGDGAATGTTTPSKPDMTTDSKVA